MPRDPFVRTVSDYVHNITKIPEGFEVPSFQDMVLTKSGQVHLPCYHTKPYTSIYVQMYLFCLTTIQIDNTTQVVTTSLYSEHLPVWQSLIPKERLLFINGDKFVKQPWEAIEEVLACQIKKSHCSVAISFHYQNNTNLVPLFNRTRQYCN